jgi:hypothetical protein
MEIIRAIYKPESVLKKVVVACTGIGLEGFKWLTTALSIMSIRAEIWTRNPPDTKQECHSLSRMVQCSSASKQTSFETHPS